jgi:3-deoxy-manno-octulosonate cytidylyltransferase (CMP-KDO synthetase)
MITAAHAFEHAADAASPHQVKVVLGLNKNALYFSRNAIPFVRDTSETATYLRHQGIYGYTRDLLLRFVRWKPSPLERAESLEQLRALENGVTIRVVVTGGGSPGVDTPEDAEAVERQLLSKAPKAAPRNRSNAR